MTVLKRTVITVIIIVTSVIIVLISYSAGYKTLPSEPKSKPNAIMHSVKYTVKEYNGKIAVFKGNNIKPLTVLEDTYVRDLPEKDRELLINGIVAHSETELNKILEDYDY